MPALNAFHPMPRFFLKFTAFKNRFMQFSLFDYTKISRCSIIICVAVTGKDSYCYYRDVFRTQSNIYDGAILRNLSMKLKLKTLDRIRVQFNYGWYFKSITLG